MKNNYLLNNIYRVIVFALPISASGVINMVSGFISMKMVAMLGKQQLAAGALAIPTFITMMTITATIFYAVGILISHQRGQDKSQIPINLIVQNGFFIAFICAFLPAIILWHMDHFLLMIGQNPQLVMNTRNYFHFAAINMFPLLINAVILQFYAGTGRPHFALYIALMTFPLNILLGYCFILGHFALPALGLSGVACGGLIAQTLTMIVTLSILYWHEKKNHTTNPIFNKFFKPDWAICKSIFFLGLPIGMQFGGELAAMTAATYLMGYFGENALAASQVVSQYTMIVIVCIMGLTQAVSLLISQAYGKHDYELITQYLKAGMSILFIICSIVSLIFLGFSNILIQFFMNRTDANLQSLATVFFVISVGLLFIDGMRHVLSGALRGLHDSQGPMRIGIIAMWLVSLPMSYFIGIVLQQGPIGLRIGFVSGFVFAVILLFSRIRKKLKFNNLNEVCYEKV